MPLKAAFKLFADRLIGRKRFLDDVTSEDELRGEDVAEEIEGVVRDD
jgi:hypothetical protein